MRSGRIDLLAWRQAGGSLAHAHSQGVVHRDIKPANILVNQYGRPFLADFNIAVDTRSGEGIFGGTLAYMAPEHLDALLQAAPVSENAVDARSDLYSLALVLFEFLTGQTPFPGKIDGTDRAESIHQLACVRRAGAPYVRALRPETPEMMDRVLRRCLEPAPARRFPSAAAFMHALDGCRELLQVEKVPGQQSRLVRVCRARPFTLLLLLATLPHLVGSIVNISYNKLLIVDKDPAQQACFHWLVMIYNAIIYPFVVLVGFWVVRRAYRGWVRLHADGELEPNESAAIRRRVLGLPGWAVALSFLGWLPGGIFFPAGLHFRAGPLSIGDSIRFFISFSISGLIAATYAYFGVQFVVLRVLYPRMWSDPSGARILIQQELRGLAGRLRRYQLLAVLIPLCGAALLIGAGPNHLSLSFRLLVTTLIILGLAGFALATLVCNRLTQVLEVLTGDVASRAPSGTGDTQSRQHATRPPDT